MLPKLLHRILQTLGFFDCILWTSFIRQIHAMTLSKLLNPARRRPHKNDTRQIRVAEHVISIKRHPRRQRLALRVKAGQVEVLAPMAAAVSELERFASDHQAWWLKALQQVPHQAIPKLRADDHSVWSYLGADLCLGFKQGRSAYSFTPAEAGEMAQLCCYLTRPAQAAARLKAVQAWYQQQAQDYLPARLAFLEAQTGLKSSEVQIKSYRARWGSCDSRRRIQLNWKLMALPSWVVDYVIVHELCHLKQMNHSPAFWHWVETHYPAYRDAKVWLKRYGNQHIQQLSP